jgi:hypothetical protein
MQRDRITPTANLPQLQITAGHLAIGQGDTGIGAQCLTRCGRGIVIVDAERSRPWSEDPWPPAIAMRRSNVLPMLM